MVCSEKPAFDTIRAHQHATGALRIPRDTRAEWEAFVGGVKDGEFDFPAR